MDKLEKRGYLDKDYLPHSLSTTALLKSLESAKPQARTAAAYLLSERQDIDEASLAKPLLKTLQFEKALYTKIELCRTLEKGSSATINEILPYLGIIGNNQHHSLPARVSKKQSYPLPRDIIARTIGHMKPENISTLFKGLKNLPLEQTRELIDAIGFLCFYNQIINEENCVK
ncbi:hypothetical protein AZF37_07605 [endosymbiont 'TC1' of Trimyema compressum]|uniref:hypothetical protein n=1 Tax=endosymbiont 'TC1' of Trimyema compressum TaxID=243899 RepID=UPI0007F0D478|nr:hypothetical protein [endosymbiont 'TC1' of Trimyema compressum]AMP21045.1 hypothetical protein AZF37_07605 [endosymbiont 'TC1' of Trimyema compressum]